MKVSDTPFSQDYDQGSSTKLPKRDIKKAMIETSTDSNQGHAPYKSGKPKRIITRAKIIHD